MKRAVKIITTVIMCSVLFTGCYMLRDREKWNLPEHPVSFEMKEAEDSDMMCITVRERSYEPFGTVKKRMDDSAIRECLGYVGDDRNYRVYSLAEEPFDNYIMLYNVNGSMEQPSYWRATDTKGENIYTPSYIESLGYEEWADSGIYDEMAAIHIDIKCESDDVKMIGLGYEINGTLTGSMQSMNADGSLIKKGNNNRFDISEFETDGKALKGEPFRMKITITVTDMNGAEHEAECTFDKEVTLEDTYFFNLKGDASNGYRLELYNSYT